MALIIGVLGACRKDELHKLSISDIIDRGSLYSVTLPITKTSVKRNFVIEGLFYNTVKEYISCRPKDIQCSNFFLNWQKGKCTKQVIGVNKFASMPQTIAKFLKLPQPELYTGHCFRRSSTTILADAGADLITLKRHGEWKSNQVAQGYIEDSMENKRKVGNMISKSILKTSTYINTETQPLSEGVNVAASTSKQTLPVINKEIQNTSNIMQSSGSDILRMVNCQNVTINIFNENKK